MPPPTKPAAHPAPHIGSASDSSLASSYPASCSPQLPFAFTPSQHWLASLQEHQVSWLLPVQKPARHVQSQVMHLRLLDVRTSCTKEAYCPALKQAKGIYRCYMLHEKP